MNKKTSLILIFVSVFSLTILTPRAHAGSAQRHRWQGVAIGIGAAILGGAIFNHHKKNRPRHESSYRPGPAPKHRHHKYERRKHYRKQHRRHGHWELRKEWVQPTLKRVWNPGHYNRHGKWIPAGWIEVEDQPGYWTETRVWVAFR